MAGLFDKVMKSRKSTRGFLDAVGVAAGLARKQAGTNAAAAAERDRKKRRDEAEERRKRAKATGKAQ